MLNNFNIQGGINVVQNYQYATQNVMWQANANGIKTINAMGMVADNFNITIYPDLAEMLANSRSFIRFICDYKVNKAYADEPEFNIANEVDIDKNLLKNILPKAKKIITKVQNPFHPLGNLSPYESVKEACRLATRHGGAFLMFCYEDEVRWETEIDINNIDTKRKLIIAPVSLCNGNRASATLFMQNLNEGNASQIEDLNKDIQDNSKKYYSASAIDVLGQESLRLFLNGHFHTVHTSRLVPIKSGIKNYTTQAITQLWDNSILQGSIRSIAIYYLFLNKYFPEMMQEKIRTSISLAGYDLNNVGCNNTEFNSTMEALAREWTSKTLAILPQNTSVSQINTNLADLPQMFDILKQQISAETGVPLIEIDGNSASGLNATGDDTMALNEAKMKQTHCQFDSYFEFALQRVFMNRFGKSLSDIDLIDIDVILTNKPTLTPEKKDASDALFIDKIIQLQQAGILQTGEAPQLINKREINGLQLQEKGFIE